MLERKTRVSSVLERTRSELSLRGVPRYSQKAVMLAEIAMPHFKETERLNCSRQLSAGTAPGSILLRLRQDTSQHHAEVERRVDILHRVSSPASYRMLLGKFYGLHSTLEAQVYTTDSPVLTWLPDLQLRRRTSALRADLAALGVPDPGCLSVAPPQALGTAAQHFGCLYVMEGSTLGGQVIAGHVHEHLGLTSGNGCDFFTGHGAQTGARWSRFCSSIEAFALSRPAAHEEIVSAAMSVFRLFGNWMENKDDSF